MPIKLLAADLDRTLLRTDKELSDYTASVLNRCRERGVKVAFATARPARAVARYLVQVPCDGVVYHNGALAYAGGELLYRAQIDIGDARAVLRAVHDIFPASTLSCEIDDVLYANFDVSTLWNYTAARFTDFTDLPDRPADKVLAGVASAEEAEAIAGLLPGHLYAQVADHKVCMVMNRRANKRLGVEAVARRFGIAMADVAAFGDDYNDIELLRACGMGVAVANGLDEVKAAADALCGGNDDDGVAAWIERHLLAGSAAGLGNEKNRRALGLACCDGTIVPNVYSE